MPATNQNAYVYKTIPTPVGELTLVGSDRGLAAILWENDKPGRVRLNIVARDDNHPVLLETQRQLGEYFAGQRQRFTVKLDFAGTDFQKQVWQALLAITFGQTRSYGEIAVQLGNPKAMRAVGAANGKNPISIIAPLPPRHRRQRQADRLCRRPGNQGVSAATGKSQKRRAGGMTQASVFDADTAAQSLNARGWALLPRLLPSQDCEAVAGLYAQPFGFRSHVVMARHGFGRGEYRYFSYPLLPLVESLRSALYPKLAPIANRWHERMGLETRFPDTLAAFLDRCHAAGQTRPTPLLLQYREGDYNCLHQDLYGAHVFPLQVAILLSQPDEDFTGGDFVLTEQRPRMQSRVDVVPLPKGDGVIFPVNDRPVRGTRGDYRVKMRHGVSALRRGNRHPLGVIFHDAA